MPLPRRRCGRPARGNATRQQPEHFRLPCFENLPPAGPALPAPEPAGQWGTPPPRTPPDRIGLSAALPRGDPDPTASAPRGPADAERTAGARPLRWRQASSEFVHDFFSAPAASAGRPSVRRKQLAPEFLLWLAPSRAVLARSALPPEVDVPTSGPPLGPDSTSTLPTP